MKRYRTEQRRPYADDPESVFEVPVEDEAGDWVPADVAKFMLDTLKVLLNSGEWSDGALEFNSYKDPRGEEIEQLVRQAIAAADEGEHD